MIVKTLKKASGFVPGFFFAVWLCLQGCSTVSGIKPIKKQDFFIPDTVQWCRLISPVHSYRYENKKERLCYTLVRVNLADPGIVVDGSISDDIQNETINAVSPAQWAIQNDIFLAVNATPFDYISPGRTDKLKLCGLYIYKGKKLSAARRGYAALCFTEQKKAFIVNSQTDSQVKQAHFAFGGFWTILENDTIVDFKNIRNARTAVGIGDGGYTLYILVVEKNQFSSGLSFENCAIILKNAGAVKALQFDGGKSVNLILPCFPLYSVHGKRKTANVLNIRYVQPIDKTD